MSQMPEAYVVDASVAVKWFLDGEILGEQATALWYRHINHGAILAAPAHIHCEVPSVIIAATRSTAARRTIAQGRAAISQFLEVRLRIAQTNQLVLGAFELVHQHDISIYDALYLWLAQEYVIPLVTADERFFRQVRDNHDIPWLGDIDPE